jgi:hypothetical protein
MNGKYCPGKQIIFSWRLLKKLNKEKNKMSFASQFVPSPGILLREKDSLNCFSCLKSLKCCGQQTF